MNYNLIYSLTRGKWAIDPQFAFANLSLVANILDGKIEVESLEEKLKPYIVSPEAKGNGVRIYRYTELDSIPYGSVAVIRIIGSVMKQDQECGPIGMATIGERIKRVDAHPNISAIVLHIDSPGGTVDGTSDLANIIKNTEKPIIAFADGLMASAALWLGVNCDEIMANDNFCEIGSVGVMMSFFDIIPYYEKEGLKYHQLVSNLSPEKTKMFDDIRAGKYENYIKEDLDPLAEEFHRVVKENRSNVKPEHLTGKVFFAKDVMGVFVDSIGTLDDAISRATELGEQFTQLKQNTTNSNNANMKNYPLINAALALELEADAERNISLTPEMLDSLESTIEAKNIADASVAGLNAQIETANAERDSANTERDNAIIERNEATATIAERDATIVENEATIATLRSNTPGATPADHSAQKETPSASSQNLSEDKELEKLAGMSIQERIEYTREKENKNQ